MQIWQLRRRRALPQHKEGRRGRRDLPEADIGLLMASDAGTAAGYVRLPGYRLVGMCHWPAAWADQRQVKAFVVGGYDISTLNASRNARRPVVEIETARVPGMRATHPRSKAVRHKHAPTIPAM